MARSPRRRLLACRWHFRCLQLIVLFCVVFSSTSLHVLSWISVDEEVLDTIEAMVLTDTKALHLVALKTFTDVYGHKRKAGEVHVITCRYRYRYMTGLPTSTLL